MFKCFKHFGITKNEISFIKKSLLLAIIFVFISIIGVAVVSIYLVYAEPGKEVGLNPWPWNLDGQTIGNLFIFAFASAVAYAGALVVIKISERQAELTEQSTPEYEHALKVSESIIEGLQIISLRLKMLQVFYRANRFDDKAWSAPVNKTVVDVLDGCQEELVKPWVNHLSQYMSHANDRGTGRINLTAVTTAFYEACMDFNAFLTNDKNFTSNRKQIEIYVADVIDKAQKLIESTINIAKSIVIPSEVKYKLIHQALAQINYEDLKISQNLSSVANKSSQHASRKINNNELKKRLSAAFELTSKSDVSAEWLYYIEHEFMDMGTFEAIRDVFDEISKSNERLFDSFYCDVSKIEIKNLHRKIINSKGTQELFLIYIAGDQDPRFLFANLDALDRCVIVFEDFPDPPWLDNFKDSEIYNQFSKSFEFTPAGPNRIDSHDISNGSFEWSEVLSRLRKASKVGGLGPNRFFSENDKKEMGFDHLVDELMEKPSQCRNHWIFMNRLPKPTNIEKCELHSQIMAGWLSHIPAMCTRGDGERNTCWWVGT